MKTLEFAKKCNFGISNDTGCGHLIASAGIPIITIFGPTDSQKFSPYGNQKMFLYHLKIFLPQKKY